MVTPERGSRSLPARPNLRHLKDQAKDLLEAGRAKSLTDAQFKVARDYGFESWPKLKAHVELLQETGQLKEAIDAEDLPRVVEMMTKNPALHRCSAGLQQERSADVGRRMPDGARIAEPGTPRHRALDDRARQRRSPGR